MIPDSNFDFNELVKDKTFLLIGPSKSAKDEISLINFDDYDYVVRLNWHYRNSEKYGLGTRTDILYHVMELHSTYTEQEAKEWSEKGIIICPNIAFSEWPDFHRTKNFANILEKYPLKYSCISQGLEKELENRLHARASTGTYVIFDLDRRGAKRVDVIGLDFYRTGYIDKESKVYTDPMKHARESGHKVDTQLAYFKKIYKEIVSFNPLGKLKDILCN